MNHFLSVFFNYIFDEEHNLLHNMDQIPEQPTRVPFSLFYDRKYCGKQMKVVT